ncbi:MAG TPA: tetratricopeptide repeat protein [Clostridia bacterium]|nr:tetratricopeptide repeat protein [Clostridia bacterium]
MRYTRHELKSDRFAETAAEAVHWTAAHRSKLLTGGIAVALIVVLAIGGYWYVNHRNNQAGVELGKAMTIYNAQLRPSSIPADPNVVSFTSVEERSKAARHEFARIVDKYGSTHSGQLAKYFVALTEQDLGNTSDTEKQLKEISTTGDADVAALAKFALASVYRNTNREADAVRTYKDIIDHPARTVPKVTAQLELADVYAATQPAEARKIYEQIAKEDPKGPGAEIAAQRQAALKQ